MMSYFLFRKDSIYIYMAEVIRLQIEPVIHLQHKSIRCRKAEHTVQVIPPACHPVVVLVGHAMLPDKIDRRTRQIFPTGHQVGTELIKTKVRIPERYFSSPTF